MATLAFVSLCAACPTPSVPPGVYDPPILEPHVVQVLADAHGDAKSPARVALFLQRGALRVIGGAEHLVEGTATGALGDPPPRVDVGTDRVSVVQAAVGGVPPTGDASFDLRLGGAPIRLSIDTGSGESQSIDLGGMSLASAHVHTDTGHITLDWSRPNPTGDRRLELSTEAGTLELSHLGRFGGKAVEVKENGGLVILDLGDAPAQDVAIDAEVGTGRLVVRVPKSLAARARVTPPTSDIVLKGWRPEGDAFVIGDADAAPRVVLRVKSAGGRVELVGL